ncbi:MAG: leucine-rich repeat domain-containing protein [Candidatus Nanoarchaeia archaeon]|nr:leucine-rich repeat domain-containing protein [Candidatus Nanoarchaeia archaeon]
MNDLGLLTNYSEKSKIKFEINREFIPNSCTSYAVAFIENDYITGIQMRKIELNYIPEIFSKLEHLKSLEMSHCNVESLDNLENLCKLTELKLDGNEITSMGGIMDLYNLEKIDLSSNEIIKIEGLAKLKNLKYLDLNFNKISDMKGFNLHNLKYLGLSNNNIRYLPDNFGKLNIAEIDLSNNKHLSTYSIMTLNCMKNSSIIKYK